MFSRIKTAIVYGIDSTLINVETDISEGMPVFEMVGFLGSEVKEAKERVKAALRNSGHNIPLKRITINLSPANLKKSGTQFDLPVAISLLTAMNLIDKEKVEDVCVLGELSLDGQISPVKGVLSMVLRARDAGISTCIVPYDNYEEASLVKGIVVKAFKSLEELVAYLTIGKYSVPVTLQKNNENLQENEHDFMLINGQPLLRRACEIAISGMHNFLMIGPPGAGKSMIAKCIPSILPSMSFEEKLELSKIYSVCGMLENNRLMDERPFRSPHHTISPQGLCGGGGVPKPGEISLAHNGVLFLDELTEFDKATLESLRQPLEDKKVTISRVNGTYTYPANFVLIAAMNSCNCGYFPDLNRCTCSSTTLKRYIGKISQPLLDRIDICVEAKSLTFFEISDKREKNESSAAIRERVAKAQEVQRDRYKDENFLFNKDIPSGLIDKYCHLDASLSDYMHEVYDEKDLTARTYHKVLKVARTIADMAGAKEIELIHLQEAILYRGVEKNFWEKEIV